MTAGVFFDLDRTLMAGSSGFHWARAARRAGLTTRRQLASDAFENIRFRLHGSTDEATNEVQKRVGAFLKGRRVLADQMEYLLAHFPRTSPLHARIQSWLS